MSKEIERYAHLNAALAEQGLAAVDRAKVETVVNDFNEAMDLILKYQRSLYVLHSPDPCILQANALLKKYGREPYGATPCCRVIVDGIDITEHPEREATAILEEEFQTIVAQHNAQLQEGE